MASYEGKTILPPMSSLCEGCEGNDSIMYCSECPIFLCNFCSKSHQKIKATSSHQLVPITSRKSILTSGEAPSLTIPCVKHTNDFAKLICKNCEVVICTTCRSEHKNHTFMNAHEDLNLLQKIAVNMISKLLEQVRELDSEKVSAQQHLTLYKDVKRKVEQWRKVIVDCANHYADELQRKLDEKIKQTAKTVNDKCENISKLAEKSEKQLSKLNLIRRSTDAVTLLVGITESDHIIKYSKLFLTKNEIGENIPTREQMLPNMSKLNQLSTDIKDVFCVKFSLDTPKITPPQKNASIRTYEDEKRKLYFKYLKEGQDFKLSTERIHFICEQNIDKNMTTITTYASGTSEIFTYNLSTDVLSKPHCDMKIGQMIKTEDWYVIMDSKLSIHMLNSKFRKSTTLASTSGKFKPWRICLYGENAFLKCETSRMPPLQLRFTEVSLESDKPESRELTTVNFHEHPDYIAIHKNENYLTMVLDTQLYRVNLSQSKITKLPIRNWTYGTMYSLLVDNDDNLLIGDQDGRIHLFTPELRHSIIHDLKERVDGLTLLNGKLVAAYGKPSHIKLFQ